MSSRRARSLADRGGSLLIRLRWAYVGFVFLYFAVSELIARITEGQSAHELLGIVVAVGLVLSAWRPFLGAVVLLASMSASLFQGQHLPAALILPLSALMLTLAHSRWRTPVVGLMSLLALIDALASGQHVVQTVLYALILGGLTALTIMLGDALRQAVEAVRTAEQILAEADSRSTVRAREREALATELADLLETELAGIPPEASERASVAELHTLLNVAVSRASRSLQDLRTLVSTLREGRTTTSVSSDDLVAAVENAEDALTAHGFHVVLGDNATPPASAAQTALLQRILGEATHIFIRDADPSHPITLRMKLDGSFLALTVSATMRKEIDAEHTNLRNMFGEVEAAGGEGGISLANGMVDVSVRLPLVSESLSDNPHIPSSAWPREALQWVQQRRRVLVTGALAGLFLIQVISTVLVFQDPRDDNPYAFLFGLVSIVLSIILVWSRRAGLLLAVLYGALMLFLGLEFNADVWLILAVLGSSSLRFRGVPLFSAIAFVFLYVVARAATLPEPLSSAIVLLDLVLPTAAVVMGTLTVDAVSRSRENELLLLQEQQRRIRRAERQALASELHDVLAHHLSLIVIEARQAAETSDIKLLRNALHTVRSRNEAALADMRLVTALLRDETRADEESLSILDPRQTAQGLATTLTKQGFRCDLRITLGPLGATARRTLTRILRESVTNAIRYAAAGSTITIRLMSDTNVANVEITSALRRSSAKDRSGLSTGTGLEGLSERVSLTGGTFSAGPENGFWIVRATIPAHSRAALYNDPMEESPTQH